MCGDIILEQDIPASLEEEVVTNSGTEAEYEDNSDHSSLSPNIDSHSTAHSSKVNSDATQRISYGTWSKNPRSLLKTAFAEPTQLPKRTMPKFKQTLFVNKNLLKLNQYKFSTDQNAGTSLLKSKIIDKKVIATEKRSSVPATKFKQSVALLKRNIPAPQNDKLKNVLRRSKERPNKRTELRKVNSTTSTTSTKFSAGKRGNGKSGGGKTFVDLHGENITINHDADGGFNLNEINLSIKVPVESEVVISIAFFYNFIFEHSKLTNEFRSQVKVKNESDSDIEIDIESDSPMELNNTNIAAVVKSVEHIESIEYKVLPERKIKIEPKYGENPSEDVLIQKSEPSTTLSNELESMATPSVELEVHDESVTELEKFFHPEFFEGRPTKTPERYLKIRDYILNAWKENRPVYVSKTTVRNGLKHCGDVNCISRIHCMLEQIGAINFGHAGDQFDYIRPLSKLKEHFAQSTRNKSSTTGGIDDQIPSTSLVLGRRQRMKSFNSPLAEKEVDANYTVSHANGISSLVYQTVPKEREHYRREAALRPVKFEFELIECLRFSKDQIPPFKISITLSTLLCLHLHALSSKFEVMGFLGGYCSKSVGRNKLSLTRYKPCKTASQTGTTCEMCPGNYLWSFFFIEPPKIDLLINILHSPRSFSS